MAIQRTSFTQSIQKRHWITAASLFAALRFPRKRHPGDNTVPGFRSDSTASARHDVVAFLFIAAGISPPSSFGGGADMGNADARDVASYFKQLGAKFPEGSFAVYQPKSRVLVIHNTDDNLQMDDQLAGGAGFRQALVELELSAIECSLPPGTNPLSMPPLAYSDLERLPAKSVKLLDRISSTSKSGQRIYATHVVNPATGADTTSNEPGKFAPGEWGTHAETESNVGSDGCDVNIDFRFRKQLDDHDPKTLLEIYFDCTFLCGRASPWS